MLVKELIIDKETRELIDNELIKIGVDGENLQEKIVFKFKDDFIDGQGRAEILLEDDTKSYITLEKVNDTYELPIKSIITKKGLNYIQLVIDEGTDENSIPIFKSKKISLFVAESINAVEEAPEGYAQWIEIANTKLTEIDNLDVDVSKEDTTSTIIVTKKDGTQKSVEVKDGTTEFATFEINNDMELICYTTDDMYLEFNINDEGELEVLI